MLWTLNTLGPTYCGPNSCIFGLAVAHPSHPWLMVIVYCWSEMIFLSQDIFILRSVCCRQLPYNYCNLRETASVPWLVPAHNCSVLTSRLLRFHSCLTIFCSYIVIFILMRSLCGGRPDFEMSIDVRLKTGLRGDCINCHSEFEKQLTTSQKNSTERICCNLLGA